MIRDKSPRLEASEALNEYYMDYNKRMERKILEESKKQAKFKAKIEAAKSKRINRQEKLAENANKIKTDLLESVLKSIYIGALLDNVALTNEGIKFASSIVESYVEQIGTDTILRRLGKTYVQDCIKYSVLNTYNSICEADEEEDDDENFDVDTSSDSEDTESQDVKDTTDTEVSDDDSDDEENVAADEDEKEVSDKDRAKMYDNLSKEEDINKAVQLISQRISDAEQQFIQKNEEDKKALDDIANKFAERIQKVSNDAESTEEDVEKAQEEAAIVANRSRNMRRDNRPRNVFEQVVINLTGSIVNNPKLRSKFYEDGILDMGSVIESAKCIYGFLEFVNTLKLETVDAKYIENALKNI